MKISHNGKVMSTKRITAADEDMDFNGGIGEQDIIDTIDDVSDSVEDLQDAVDEIEEDDVDIEIENNIANHYIAECDVCHGVFISALVETDQEVDMISGVCPLCGKETDQYLNWIIRDV